MQRPTTGGWQLAHALARKGGGQLSPITRIPSFVSQLTAMLDVSAAGMCIYARMTGRSKAAHLHRSQHNHTIAPMASTQKREGLLPSSKPKAAEKPSVQGGAQQHRLSPARANVNATASVSVPPPSLVMPDNLDSFVCVIGETVVMTIMFHLCVAVRDYCPLSRCDTTLRRRHVQRQQQRRHADPNAASMGRSKLLRRNQSRGGAVTGSSLQAIRPMPSGNVEL